MKIKSLQPIDISSKQLLFAVLFLETLAIALAIGIAIANGKGAYEYFGEGEPLTIISCLQILVFSILALVIFLREKRSPDERLFKNAGFWLILSMGAFFLALDDAFSIHEQLDVWMHKILNIQETMVTDLTDDIIVGIYLILALVYIASQWRTLGVFRSSFNYFKAGFLLGAVMVVLDILSNNTLFVSMVTDDSSVMNQMLLWLGVLEEAVKVWAEGFFLVGVYQCWRVASASNKKQSTVNAPSTATWK
ncbi:MAG: hypothetical protein AAF652_02350 [Cyanobacteria bacterium P01_C01_bin.72]